jgi:hypothetical protein
VDSLEVPAIQRKIVWWRKKSAEQQLYPRGQAALEAAEEA